MKPEEAIEVIGGWISDETKKRKYAKITVIELSDALVTLKAALEKQVAKKPDLEADGYDDSGNLIYDTWICPCCETRYEVDYDEHDCCPSCGQKIDWSEEE